MLAGDSMGDGVLHTVGKRIHQLPVPLVAAAAFVFCVLSDGLGRSPAFDRFLAMAQSPMSDPVIAGTGSFVLSSPAGSLIAASLGATRPATFAVLNLALIATVFAGTVWMVRRHHGDDKARTVALVWAALPTSTVLLTWLGQPDPLIIGAGTALVFVANPLAAAAWALLAGFTSGPQAGLLVALLAYATRRRPVWILAALAGVAAGAALVPVWQAAAGIEQEVGRAGYLLTFGPATMIRGALSAWQPLLWSLFAGAWPVVGWLVWRDRMVRTVTVMVAALAVALVTFDHTRVFALVTWPVVLTMSTRIDDDRAVGWLAVAALLVPPSVVWAGAVLGPAW